MERRERNRVDLKLLCRVLPVSKGGAECWQEIRNISRTGMLLRWDAAPDSTFPLVGEPVTIELKLPVNPLFGQRCMRFKARVVRVTEGRNVAVRIQRSRVRPQALPLIFEMIPTTYIN